MGPDERPAKNAPNSPALVKSATILKQVAVLIEVVENIGVELEGDNGLGR